MPAFTLPLTPEGAIVQATITPAHDHKGEAQEVSIKGVLDTGADITYLDLSVVHLLGLEPIGRGWFSTLDSGPTPIWADLYKINIRISAPGTVEPSYNLCNMLAFGVDLPRVRADGHHAMFGRNVLEYCQFVFNGVLRTFTVTYAGQGLDERKLSEKTPPHSALDVYCTEKS